MKHLFVFVVVRRNPVAVIHETAPVAQPKISVISFCLNGAKYLRATIESVLGQTYTNYELVVKDGGSTDGTIEILKEYNNIRWMSEKEGGDNPTLDAIWQSFQMSRGDYIIYLAVSDGLMDRDWFRKCVEVLDVDSEVSWVWGLPQNMSEEGHLRNVVFPEYLQFDLPQKMDFLPFWLAGGHGMESNACFRRQVFETCFPTNHPEEPYRFHSTLGFNYRLNTRGYLPYFIPTVSYFGRSHKEQRQESHNALLDSVCKRYFRDIYAYRRDFLAGTVAHRFRDGSSGIIREVAPHERSRYRRKIWEYRLKMKIRRELQKLLDHVRL
jgi:glycosyltransferase involved in cell wall biosynthesis